MGGMFQALYLPEWQCCTVRLLASLGFSEEADRICPWDGSGYLCGPVFALFRGDGFAAPAGPAEFWMEKPDIGALRNRMEKTLLRDAHLFGLSEMVPDLLSRDEREEDWYRAVAQRLYHGYPEN